MKKYVRCHEEDALGDALQRRQRARLARKLHNALPVRLAPLVHDDDGPFHIAELAEGLLEHLVGDVLVEVLDVQRGPMRGKAHAHRPTSAHRAVERAPSVLRVVTRVLCARFILAILLPSLCAEQVLRILCYV